MNKPIHTACIIDDDKAYVFLTERVIKMKKLCKQLLIYENGKIALDELSHLLLTKSDFPEVILLDINMPEMDGWQFLDEFVKIKPLAKSKITIYIVSSSIDERDVARARSYDEVSDYVLKPINYDALDKLFTVVTAGK